MVWNFSQHHLMQQLCRMICHWQCLQSYNVGVNNMILYLHFICTIYNYVYLYQGEAFCSCIALSAATMASASADMASMPCHPNIYKIASSIYFVFNILNTGHEITAFRASETTHFAARQPSIILRVSIRQPVKN